ncbi:MAG TPA: hypothetical protein VGQ51_19315 [Puia sp.]|jgi:hypothetical protein|nr:hypothetical protein [Puia sp.]
MILHKISLFAFSLAAVTLVCCNKQSGLGPNYTDYNPPAAPIVVTNAVDYRPDPTVTTSLSGDSSITITMALTGNSGKSMTQITNVIGSTSYAAIQSATSKWYNAAPITATNNSVTFKTSIGEYFKNYPLKAGTNPAATANVELAFRFYFSIELSDGSVVYPTPVRVLVLQ